ncbi:hypothetical protein [Roseococcus suduntuyensis]|uniref:Uncharacterized protein n=1 Tax=Roseococcus suduntuyensis TaxID=455361 RepID=A0A840AHX1_9PROT|nr:hypothetical protein [Roseococcus suduntuyensis]MBB3900146.1 hypothetical protein [Roseococcus suduntuyensis]
MRHAITTACLAGLLSACAVVDPILPLGPEEGYCYPSPRATRDATAATPAPEFDLRDHVLRCPPGHGRNYALVGERNTAIHLDEALAFLRDRRRRMSERERQLVQLDGAARVGIAAGTLTAIGAAAFGARPDLVLGTGLATGTSYVAGYGFAPATMRNVYNAGVAALSCVETRALSAHITPLQVPQRERAALDVALRHLVEELDAARRQLEATTPPDPALNLAINQADEVMRSARAGLSGLGGQSLAGPLIANAVYDRTLAIVIQVNSEVQRATPNLDAIMNLARQAGGASLDGVADSTAALRNASRTPSPPSDRTGQPTTEQTPPERTAAGTIDRLRAKADATAEAASKLADALTQAPQQRLAQVRACAFQQVEGRGLTLTPGTTPSIAAATAARPTTTVLAVAGGRAPYRISATGNGAAELRAEPEFSPGQFTLRNTGAGAGASASFLITDQGGESAVVTLTVR